MSHVDGLSSTEQPPATLPGGPPVAAFDIGGTWFRGGVWGGDGSLSRVSRRPAVNFLNTPHAHPGELQRALVEYLIEQIDAIRDEVPNVETASVSLGAAMNGNTGEVLQASPLWGPRSGGFPLRQALEARRPGVRWVIVNDVTAALLRHVWELRDGLQAAGCPRAALFTISTGIAARTFDVGRRAVPVDRAHGVQGEVGHLAVDFRYDGDAFPGRCDCGGANHVNAFSSGRGIERLARAVAAARPATLATSALSAATGGDPGRIAFADVAAAVGAGDGFALSLLDAACGPVADLIVTLLMYDPEVERVFMVGGVVGRLESAYMNALHAALDRRGLYQVTPRDPAYFRNRVVRGLCDDQSGMIGAAIFAQTLPPARPSPCVSIPTTGPVHTAFTDRSGRSRVVGASRRYEYLVEFVPGLLDAGNDTLSRAVGARRNDRRLVLIDDGAAEHYTDAVAAYFYHHGVRARIVPVATSEKAKTLDKAVEVVDQFARVGVLRRSEPVLAVGGGILMDVVGFAASIYRRGIPYVRVPTTLMGMVDAGVGVKTGVSFRGKNRLGSFYPPLATLIDLRFLATLPPRYMRSGVAEIVKIALVREAALFDVLEAGVEALLASKFQDGPVGADVVRAAVHGMLDELEPNLFEDELRRRVDFGHSFSPGLEAAAGFDVLHGEAVSIDMALSAVLSRRRGLIGDDLLGRILSLLRRAGLPLTHPEFRLEVLTGALRSTLEHRDGQQRVPLVGGVGDVRFVDDVTEDELRDGLAALEALAPIDGAAAGPCRRMSDAHNAGDAAAAPCHGQDRGAADVRLDADAQSGAG